MSFLGLVNNIFYHCNIIWNQKFQMAYFSLSNFSSSILVFLLMPCDILTLTFRWSWPINEFEFVIIKVIVWEINSMWHLLNRFCSFLIVVFEQSMNTQKIKKIDTGNGLSTHNIQKSSQTVTVYYFKWEKHK